MLSPEHVRTKRRGDRLELLPLTAQVRERALFIADEAIGIAQGHAGQPREVVERAWAAIEAKPSERRLADGLVKLVDDACAFEAPGGFDAPALRSEVFLRAAELRKSLGPGERLDRAEVLAAAARALGIDDALVEEGLYGDLRGRERLHRAEPLSAEDLVLRYERAQVQAVLLRAARVTADVKCASPETYRALFHKLKFRQLLYRITALGAGAYRLEIDGPMSLFEATTKYGLELALLVPALFECDAVDLTADLRWGKRRDPLTFQFRHERSPGVSGGQNASPELAVRDDVREVIQAVNAARGDFRAEIASELIDLPGLGLCVPDLCFLHVPSGARIFCEVLGFWSRDAVFRRVELAKRGLPKPILFVASARLRVSEELLDGIETSALYVYKGKINVKTLLRRLEELLT